MEWAFHAILVGSFTRLSASSLTCGEQLRSTKLSTFLQQAQQHMVELEFRPRSLATLLGCFLLLTPDSNLPEEPDSSGHMEPQTSNGTLKPYEANRYTGHQQTEG